MPGKGKKIVSLAYKEKLLAQIAHYERRIEEALHTRKQLSFKDERSDDDSSNPYKLNIQQSGLELKQKEASLSDRASLTLELAMLTIMQSEVNVMVTPPEVRRPIQEGGVWQEVVAECKIDLVAFTITFYAHKPYRRFAPIRYRNVAVTLVKPAHQRELAKSVLSKLNRPNLALQVLQSYSTAFRSRRTTLLELAEKYADKLSMEAMPEGGYRVRFLDLLRVDWTLENMWSPVVPFCHRMKFEVEYMPKDYIHAIGKLYKQFKDPSLETSERTHVLSKIFDICLQAQAPAREMQETFESDPETAGRLHERRTTIDQEPEVPNVEHSPKKPKGKENKPQNRKTTMAPPKTIPKKAKKVDAKKINKKNDVENNIAKKSNPEDDVVENRKGGKRTIDNDGGDNGEVTNAKDIVSENRRGVKRGIENDGTKDPKNTKEKYLIEKRKGVERGIESDDINGAKKANAKEDVAGNGKGVKRRNDNEGGVDGKKNNMKDNAGESRKGLKRVIENDDAEDAEKVNAEEDAVENRKGVKRGTENDGSNVAKKSKTESNVDNSKSKGGLKGGKDGSEPGSKNNVEKRNTDKVVMHDDESRVVSSKINGQKKVSSKVAVNAKNIDKAGTAISESNLIQNGDRTSVKSKSVIDNAEVSDVVEKGKKIKDASNAKDKNTEDSETVSKKGTKKGNLKSNDKNIVNSKDMDIDKNIQRSKKSTENMVSTKTDGKKVANPNNETGDVTGSKKGAKKGEDGKSVTTKDKRTVDVAITKNKNKVGKGENIISKEKSSEENVTNINNTEKEKEVISKKAVVAKDASAKLKTASKDLQDMNKADGRSKQGTNNHKKAADVNDNIAKTSELTGKTKDDFIKKNAPKGTNTAKSKDIVQNVANKQKNNSNKETELKETNQVVEKSQGLIGKHDKNKNITQNLGDKRKMIDPKNSVPKSDQENKVSRKTVDNVFKSNVNVQKADKGNEILAKKNKIAKPNSGKKIDDIQSTKSTDKTEKPRSINPKLPENATRNVLKEKSNRDETIQKVVEKNRIGVKNNAAIKKNEQKNTNPLNVTITKSKNIPINKIQPENQIKLADKLKTKIPMMKSKFKFASLNDKLANLGRISKGVEKTKIPQKTLPVFKKVVKNLPTRVSPRKLASTFKPSSLGFTNKKST